jgi:hypothetical protein
MVVDRYHGREAMVLFERADLLRLLERFEFEPQASFADGGWAVRLPEFGLVAGGEDFDAAVDELLVLAEQYVADFVGRYDFFMQTDRQEQAGWVLRFALTPTEERRALLVNPPSAASARPQSHEAPVVA